MTGMDTINYIVVVKSVEGINIFELKKEWQLNICRKYIVYVCSAVDNQCRLVK